MEEKVLQGKKNGMLVLFLTIALFLAAGIGLVFAIARTLAGRWKAPPCCPNAENARCFCPSRT